MHTPRAFANAKQINETSGISSSLLKYYRTSGKLKGYRLADEREWLYRLDQVNSIFTEVAGHTRQNRANLVIVNTNEINGGQT